MERKPVSITIEYDDMTMERYVLTKEGATAFRKPSRRKKPLARYSGPCSVFTRLQDENWEFHASFPTLPEAILEARRLYRGALGKSCMYQVVDSGSGKVLVSSGSLVQDYFGLDG